MERRRDSFLNDPTVVETTVELTCHAKRKLDGGLLVEIIRPLKGNKSFEFLDVTRFLPAGEAEKLDGEIASKADAIFRRRGGFLRWLSKR